MAETEDVFDPGTDKWILWIFGGLYALSSTVLNIAELVSLRLLKLVILGSSPESVILGFKVSGSASEFLWLLKFKLFVSFIKSAIAFGDKGGSRYLLCIALRCLVLALLNLGDAFIPVTMTELFLDL